MTHVKFMAGAAVLALMSSAAMAQIAVSANDGKVKLVDGVVQTVKDGKDTVSFIDLSATPPKIVVYRRPMAFVSGASRFFCAASSAGLRRLRIAVPLRVKYSLRARRSSGSSRRSARFLFSRKSTI